VLAAATGLGGRDRKIGSDAERARVNVTRAIRSALARINDHDPALGHRLDITVHTGTFCIYQPDQRAEVEWIVRSRSAGRGWGRHLTQTLTPRDRFEFTSHPERLVLLALLVDERAGLPVIHMLRRVTVL
jgi:hypothetical protein